eukprot:UN16240
MNWHQKFKHAINSIHNESNFSNLGKELFNLTKFYLENDFSGYEDQYDSALENSEVMKQHFQDMGHPSMVSKSVRESKLGEFIEYKKLEPVVLPEIEETCVNRTVIVCLRHFL